MVHTLAGEVIALNRQVGEIDKAIEDRFREHRDFEVITSMPGLGVILGAEFLAATGGDMTAFGTADRLAGFGGVTPPPFPATPARSAAISAGHDATTADSNASSASPRCSASATATSPAGFTNVSAPKASATSKQVLALARRRVNVLWALLRDGRAYELTPPTARAARQTALGISVSAMPMPNFWATAFIPAHSVSYSGRTPVTIRTARRRSSSGYWEGRAMNRSSQVRDPPPNLERFRPMGARSIRKRSRGRRSRDRKSPIPALPDA